MICKRCNFKNSDDAKFCGNCGAKLDTRKKINLNKTPSQNSAKKLTLKKEESHTTKKIEQNNIDSNNQRSDYYKQDFNLNDRQNAYTYEPTNNREFNYNTQNKKNSNSNIIKIIIGIAAIIAIVFLVKDFFPKEENTASVNNYSSFEDSYTPEEDKFDENTIEDGYTQDEDQFNENTIEENIPDESINNLMPYIETSNIQDYSNYNSPSDFALFSSDEYSFGYPKNFYNYAEETDDGYTLWSDNGASLTFTVTPRDSYLDMTTEMDDIYNYYLDMFYLSETVVYNDDESKDYRRFIVSGYSDSSKDAGNYCFCNVRKDKIEFYHLVTPISGYSKEELNHANYILDTIYRMCSFTGTSYQPRTYDQFINNDMGTKK